ncbi:MAG TPA: hypothetical protein VGW38_22190 [Chloroflexota bacterium]|nr:hypothetical protein [Chloroflexota bacterium]
MNVKNGHVQELNDEQAWEIFDQRARHYLEMSGEEFLKAWDDGKFGDPEDPYRPGLMRVVMSIPLVRPTR